MLRVPQVMLPVYEAVVPVLLAFCDAFLDERYEAVLTQALAKLCRMRPSPLLAGTPTTWAAGICYFICAQNDRLMVSCQSRIPATAVAAFFDLKPATVAAKAAQIRKLFHVQSFNERCWDFHSRTDPWRVEPQ